MKKNLFQHKTGIMGINVTPIIDVALVLVIILMITTPIMTISNLSVDLPAAHVRAAEQGKRLNITVNPAGEVALDKDIIPRENLVGALTSRLADPANRDLMVVVRADGRVAHQTVRQVMNEARQAGARRLAIATSRAGEPRPEEVAWKSW
jgi:biopolymer transport protein ExbD